MPRPKSEISAYRKHSSGQARVTINGHDYILGPHGTRASKRKYDRILSEYLASGRSTSFGAGNARRSSKRISYVAKMSGCFAHVIP